MVEKKVEGVLPTVIFLVVIAVAVVLLTPPRNKISTQMTIATDLPTPSQPIVPYPGRWLGKSFTTAASSYPPIQLLFDVHEDGSVRGVLSIYPIGPDIPEGAVALINQNGCNVDFETVTAPDAAIRGTFLDDTTALVRIETSACSVKFFGEITFAEPISGEFVAEYNEEATLVLQNKASTPLTPIELGRGVFLNYCSACHGVYGEGAPGIPSLNTEEVRRRSDEQLLEIINLGVINTAMPAWGQILKEEEKQGVLQLLRNIETLQAR